MLPIYFAYLTIPIAFLSISLYIRDIIRGIVKPNKVTWLFWGIAPLIGSFIGYKSGVPIPYLIATFMSGFGCFLVVIVALFYKHAYWKISSFDILCGILSLVSIIIWLTTQNAILSLIFTILADVSAGLPTIIKSWAHSETETVAPYSLGILNQVITFFLIPSLSFLNFAFPLYLISVNTIIIVGIYHKKFK